MKRFKKILLYIDALAATHNALDRAAELAERNDAELKIVDVVSELSAYFRMVLHDHQQQETARRQQKLSSIAAALREKNVEVSFEVLCGRPFVEITREVLLHGHDLLIKDAKGLPGQDHLLIGSVEMRLLRNCPCPVWLVKPKSHRPYDRIVAAIDPESTDTTHANLNSMILELAASLAKMEGAELSVICAWEVPGESFIFSRLPVGKFEEYVTAAQVKAEQSVCALLATTKPRVAQQCVDFQHGEAGPIIASHVKSSCADLLIMGSVARTGIPGFLMGDTAESVLRQVECSVLTIKPPGFVSPIRLEEKHATHHPTSQPPDTVGVVRI